ncbi:hypothetical protein [Allohahella sp. A8]|uniref:hypothetical protein n=1 Tax=Allohahella sp. A8 TaxID=3141461 RepID=UPI003A80712E
MRQDLAPLLSNEAFVIYTDLWADPSRDPTVVVKEAVRQSHMAANSFARGAITKAELNLAGFAKVTLEDPWTDEQQLPIALNSIQAQVQMPLVLIIDEAQHALAHPDGMGLMLSLKSARDQINTLGEANLRIVMSGSDRDKLMRLVHEAASPFYGCSVATLPPLGRPYLEHIAERIKASTNIDFVDINALEKTFELVGHQPETLAGIIGMAANPLIDQRQSFSARLITAGREHRQNRIASYRDKLDALPALDRAIMERIGSMDGGFAVGGKESLAVYSKATGEPVTAQRVQKALHRLREHSPPLLWKSAAAEYAIEDAGMRDWIRDGQDDVKGGGFIR